MKISFKIPLFVAVYMICILLYLFYGEDNSKAWIVFYCCIEKIGLASFLFLLTQKHKTNYIDRLFLHFGMAVNIITALMYILTLISDKFSIILAFKCLQYIILAGIISLIVNWFGNIFLGSNK